MRRRELIAGVAGLGIVASGGALAVRGPPALERFANQVGEGDDATGEDTDDSDDQRDRDPVEIETVDVTGSELGSLVVPDTGQVTFVDFFATWCAPCEEQMPALAEAAQQVPDDVRFLSVTNELVGRTLSEDELREWWDEHDGNWLLGLDPTAALSARYGVVNYPTAVTIDTNGETHWSHRGLLSADEILTKIEETRAVEPAADVNAASTEDERTAEYTE